MIHRSPLPDVEIPETSVTTVVLRHAGDLADKTALVDGPTGREITYGRLDQLVRSFAGGLAARGFGRGDVLALMAPNVPEYAVVFHGVAFAGGVITTVNPTYTAREVHHQLTDSGATILVTIPMFLDVAREAMAGTAVKELFVLGEAEGVSPVTELFGAPLAEQVPVDPDDVVCLPYSSGTTGLSKGVMLTHRNLVANIVQTGSASAMATDDKTLAVLPFFHIYGMQVLMNTGLAYGGTVVTMPRFDLEQFLSLHEQYAITRTFVAPPIVVALAKHPMVDRFDLSALREVFSGAAPLSAELGDEASQRLGCPVVQGYGMTEMSPVSHLTPQGMFKPGSVGVTAPNTECRVVDPGSGEDLPVGADGELWVRGPQVMKGYLNNEAATDMTLVEGGWMRTGDIAHVDEDGHVFIVDRLKELIKYKGFQVPPAELEGILLTHPAVADAAVIGLPDTEAGEIPTGYVVLKPGATATPEEVRDFVAGQVAHYKRLGSVTVLDAIPKSASGKILRRVLKAEAIAQA